MKFKNLKKEYVLLTLFVILFYTPCSYYKFLSNSTNFFIFRTFCAAIILYGCKLGINSSVIITTCILVLFYKINTMCGLKYREGMIVYDESTPYLHTKMLIPLDVGNKMIKTNDLISYEKYIKNVNDNSILGKLYENEIIPKHLDFNRNIELDRKIKVDSELNSAKSREIPTQILTKEINEETNWFNIDNVVNNGFEYVRNLLN